MITYHQMTLADVFTETQEIFKSDKPEFLKLLESVISAVIFLVVGLTKRPHPNLLLEFTNDIHNCQSGSPLCDGCKKIPNCRFPSEAAKRMRVGNSSARSKRERL